MGPTFFVFSGLGRGRSMKIDPRTTPIVPGSSLSIHCQATGALLPAVRLTVCNCSHTGHRPIRCGSTRSVFRKVSSLVMFSITGSDFEPFWRHVLFATSQLATLYKRPQTTGQARSYTGTRGAVTPHQIDVPQTFHLHFFLHINFPSPGSLDAQM